jgi:hypothetical protein
VSATYDATIVAANAAAVKIEAIVTIETVRSLSLPHKIALSDLPESGEGVKRCGVRSL